MNSGAKKVLFFFLTAALYATVLWGLIFVVLILNQALGDLLILFFLAAASLVPVLLAERFWCKKAGLHWLVVRLGCPALGGALFLVTAIIANPTVMLSGLLLLLFFGVFALFQIGLVILSVIGTVVYGKIKKGREQPLEPARMEDPRFAPIKLPPKAQREAPLPAQPVARPKHRDWKSSLLAAALVIATLGGMTAMLLWFPSYRVAVGLLPAVTQEGIAEKSYYDWRGRRASGDIPALTATEQLQDGTYDALTYLTVETDEIIPLGLYKLKDYNDSRPAATGRAQARAGRGPLQEYVTFTAVNAMYYGQYCLIKLEDGSYIGAYLDSSYTTALGRVRLPVGQLEYAGSREKALLAEAAKDYPVDTESLLVLHSVENYTDIKLLDIGIRIAAVALVPVLLLGGWLAVVLVRKKRFSITAPKQL